MKKKLVAVDLFCGGGGTSTGMMMYNACVDNHEKEGLVIIRESVYRDLNGRITKESLQEALRKI